jgi:hypothetical protein
MDGENQIPIVLINPSPLLQIRVKIMILIKYHFLEGRFSFDFGECLGTRKPIYA